MIKDKERLIKFFEDTTNKQERNKKIIEAYKQGYSQYIIAKIIGISQPAVNKIVKRGLALSPDP